MKAITYIAPMLAIACSGCATAQPPPTKIVVKGDTYCQIAEKQEWSVNDSKERLTKIRKHNARYDRSC
jgi:hypothetical protein